MSESIRLAVREDLERLTIGGFHIVVNEKILKCVKCDYVFKSNRWNYPLCKVCFLKWDSCGRKDKNYSAFWQKDNLLNGTCNLLSDSDEE